MRTVVMLILLGGLPAMATAQLDTLMQARGPGGASRLMLYEDGGFALRGAFGVGAIPATGPGVHLMWYPKKAAFRAGFVDGTQWDDANIGAYSTAMGYNTTASGNMSTAMGWGTTASGVASTAMGIFTIASADNSTAIGSNTTASSDYATAMGNSTTASGHSSTAMGQNTTAEGPNSTAMSYGTTASGDQATAMGQSTTANGDNATAMGRSTMASGTYATAMGLGTTAQALGSLVIGRYNVVSGTPDAWVETEPLFVAGNGFHDGNRSNALTLLKNGELTLAGPVESQSGGFIFPDGTVQTTASSGGGTLPTNEAGSYDLGNDNGLVAEGTFDTGAIPATGPGVRLMWYPAKAAFRAGSIDGTQWDGSNVGAYSTAMGYNTTASSNMSTAMGQSTTASGIASTAMGETTTASHVASTAMGSNTTANGFISTAMGGSTTASGWYSTAMGAETTASGDRSTAMGSSTTASGDYATAMGFGTTASGDNATAMGFGTTASGDYASTMGRGTTAQAYSSLVIGRYNVISGTPDVWASTEPLFVAGNGTFTNRSNALTLLKNGTLTLAGSVESENGGFIFPDGTVQTTASSGGGTLPTNEAGSYDLGNDNGLVAEGTFDTGAIPATGAGVRLMWYPAKAAFRAGRVYVAEWDDANIGESSTAMGAGTTASGDYATAMGAGTTASGFYSTAMGSGTTASHSFSTAMGYNTTADGYKSTAMGEFTTASAESSIAMGANLTAQAYGSLVIGRNNVISGTPNSWVETEPLFVVGNGQNPTVNRSNALTLLKNGRLGLGTASPADAIEVRTDTPTTALRLKTTDSWPLRMEQTDESFFSIYNGGQPRMTIVYNGRVGIGTTTPSSMLDVNGTVRATNFVNTSDARLKRDVLPIDDPLDLIEHLRGVSYAWDRGQHPEWEPGRQLGFLAQEVAEVLPEIVHEDEAGYLSVNYQAMIPVLVEALKAQHQTIQVQQGEIAALREALETQGREIKVLLHKFDALLAEPTPSTRKAASH